MNRNTICALAIFGICILIVATAILAVALNQGEEHHVDLTFSWSTLQANVTQGDTVTVNCTVFNTDYNCSINAGLSTYAIAFNNREPPWDSSSQPRIFNITFNPWVLNSLGPRETRTSMLCINFAEDAPIGNYTFALQGYNNSLQIAVLPKLNSY